MINGSIKLFRLFGIDVYLHWSWLFVAYFMIQFMAGQHFAGTTQETLVWGGLLYLSLFAIVLMHEFGHALACRSVGGRAQHIVLWPLGGVAYVQPPNRPGAVLWSIVAGPLVNVMLVPATVIGYYLVRGSLTMPSSGDNLEVFAFSVMSMNALLLVFNMMPVYPLDGGQTLMAILWFIIGRAQALKVCSIIGLVAAAAVLLLSVIFYQPWFLVLAIFVGLQAYNGYLIGTRLATIDPQLYDERYANRAADDEVDQRIQHQIDPWRR